MFKYKFAEPKLYINGDAHRFDSTTNVITSERRVKTKRNLSSHSFTIPIIIFPLCSRE